MPQAPDRPIKFKPHLMPMPWGGRRLADWLPGPFPEGKIGEAWLLSDHPLHRSVAADGPWQGQTLDQLWAHHGQAMLGSRSRWPLLIKLLDARENLSIQVHPDDERAKRWAPQEGGKSEAWYVLESQPEGRIYLDVKRGIDPATLLRELTQGTLPLCMEVYHPHPGECFNVPAGTLHALGAGVVVLEVQQTSNATFRLYDWGRVDAKGQPRALHLEAGLASLQPHLPGAGRQAPKRISPERELLVDTPFFRMERWAEGKHDWQGPSCLFHLEGPPLDLAETTCSRHELLFLPAAAKPMLLELAPGQRLLHISWPVDVPNV